MRHFIHGFADELFKLAAFAQQAGGEQPYDAGVSQSMERSQGGSNKTGLKTGQPLPTAPAAKRPSPTPLTTPTQMVDYASRMGGGGS